MPNNPWCDPTASDPTIIGPATAPTQVSDPGRGAPTCGLPHGPDEWCGRPATVAFAAQVSDRNDLGCQRAGAVLVCEEISDRLREPTSTAPLPTRAEVLEVMVAASNCCTCDTEGTADALHDAGMLDWREES